MKGTTRQRGEEVSRILATASRWPRVRRDVEAVALVGSWARGEARDDSDVDLVVVTTRPSLYLRSEKWASAFGVTRLVKTTSWGQVTERRGITRSGLEIEFGITSPRWAKHDPPDSGTVALVRAGIKVIYDTTGRLTSLVSQVQSGSAVAAPTREDPEGELDLRSAWDSQATAWTAWARKPNHDSYWRFGRDAFFALLPAPGNLTVDLGCGEGRVSRDLAALGHRVLSIDASQGMVRAAVDSDPTIPAVVADAAALPLIDSCSDLVIAYMSLHDMADMNGAVAEVARILRPGGHLCAAVVHPLNSAGQFSSLEPDADFIIRGSYLEAHLYVDRIERDGMAMTFSSLHHPLQDYFVALEKAGLLVEAVREIPADEASAQEAARRQRWRRLPLFLNIRAAKPWRPI